MAIPVSGDLTISGNVTATNLSNTNTGDNPGVTNIAVSAPLTGGPITGTGTISMPAATSAANGYMTSTYAGKLDGIASGATANTGTVTSVDTTAANNGLTATWTTIGTTPRLTIGATQLQLQGETRGLNFNYGSVSETYSERATFIGNNVYRDPADTTSQVRTTNSHASYGHSILWMSNGVTRIYGKTETVTAGTVVTRNEIANFSGTGVTFYQPLTATSGSFSSTISASNFSGSHSGTSSGTNTGDQTSVSGSAGTVTSLAGHNISELTNNSGYTTNAGTVTSITAGTGLSGGTITGTGTISVNYGTTASTACRGDDSRLSDSRTASGGNAYYADEGFMARYLRPIQQNSINYIPGSDGVNGYTGGDLRSFTCEGTGSVVSGTGSSVNISAALFGDSTTGFQFSSTVGADNIYFRRFAGGVVQTWREIITTANASTLITSVSGAAGSVTSLSGHNISELTNNSGYTTNAGTVTSIVAGTGLTGGTISTSGTIAVSYGTTAGTACQGNDSRLSDARAANGGTSAACSGAAATVTSLAGHNISELTNNSGYTTNVGTVTSITAGTGLTGGTISTSGTIAVSYGTTAGTACQGNDGRLSDSRPASDVYAWAKASVKPTYTYTDVGAAASSHTHQYASWTFNDSAPNSSYVMGFLTLTWQVSSPTILSIVANAGGAAAQTLITSANVGSQSVSYASTAGSSASCTGNAASASQITANTPSGGTYYLATVDATGGNTYIRGMGATYASTTGILTATDFAATSDARFKTDIVPISDPLIKIAGITGVSYKWNDLAPSDDKVSTRIGVLAQDVRAVFPEAVMGNDETTLSVSYGSLVPLLIEAVKAQQKQIDYLMSRLA